MTYKVDDYWVKYPCTFIEGEAVGYHSFPVNSKEEGIEFIRNKPYEERSLCKLFHRMVKEIDWRQEAALYLK